MKKLISLVLALVMVLAVATAFAASATIVVEDTNEHIVITGRTYTAWKLFDAVYTSDGKNASYTMATDSYFYTNAMTVLEKYFTFTAIPGDDSKVVVEKKGDWEDARALANEMQSYLTSSVPAKLKFSAEADDDEKATITVDGPGYYLITGDAKSADDETKIVTAAVGAISVNDTVTVHPKADAPSLDKKAKGEVVLDSKGEQAIAQIGTDVEFEITTAIPDTTGYDKYTFIIHDSMTSGLTFKEGSLAVTIGGEDYTGGTFTAVTSTNGFTYEIPMKDLKPAGAPVVLTYKATLNDNALTTDFERNTANLEYSNNPYDDETNHTPDEHVWVIDLNIDLDKVDGKDSTKKLDGAQFKLYKNDGKGNTDWYSWDATNKKVVWTDVENAQIATTDATGKLDKQFQGLTQGTYYLREVKAPDGYNRLPSDIEIAIVADDEDATHAKITANGKDITNGTVTLTNAEHTSAQPVAVEIVENNQGTELPSTGGIGTTIFYIVGGILLIGAAVILVARRKASEK